MKDDKASSSRLIPRLIAVMLITGFIALLIPISPTSATGISLVNSWSAGSQGLGALVIDVATTTGDTVLLTIGTSNTACGVISVRDNAAGSSSVYMVRAIKKDTVDFEIWSTDVGAAKAATKITVRICKERAAPPHATVKVAATVGDYTGVAALGSAVTASGSDANPSVSLTTQGPDDWVIGGFVAQDTTLQTALIGNLRQVVASSGIETVEQNVDTSLVDNTSATAGSVTIATTHAAVAWAGAALGLRPLSLVVAINGMNLNPYWGDVFSFQYWNIVVFSNTYAATQSVHPYFRVIQSNDLLNCSELVLEISLDNSTWSAPLTTSDITSPCRYDPTIVYDISVPGLTTYPACSCIWYMRHEYTDAYTDFNSTATVSFDVTLVTG